MRRYLLVLGAAAARGLSTPAKFPGAPQPGHDISGNLAARDTRGQARCQ
jgi:hypothetical protein